MPKEAKRAKVASVVSVDGTGLDDKGKRTLAMLTALETEDGLSSWEVDFVSSVTDWFLKEGRELTPKQFETLERIYHKFN